MYAWRHAGLHATFHAQWQALALSDIYLVLADGRIIYSVTKSDGFLSKVGDLGSTALADVATKALAAKPGEQRSEEHTSELQSLMRISYAVFCLKKKSITKTIHTRPTHKQRPKTKT